MALPVADACSPPRLTGQEPLARRTGCLRAQRSSALAGRFVSLEEQMVGADHHLDRIERRLDLVDTPA
jgi:hypothetical protein